MTKYVRLFTLLSLLCVFVLPSQGATTNPVSQDKVNQDKNETVESLLTSSPPGATVTYTAFGKSRVVGKTPLRWSFLKSDIYRSSMVPMLTFELAGHETERVRLGSSKKVHVTLRTVKPK